MEGRLPQAEYAEAGLALTAEVGLTEVAQELYYKMCKDDERSRLQDVSVAVEDLLGDSAADDAVLNQRLTAVLDQLD